LSSLTTIRITHEQGFFNKECLEEALKVHKLNSSFEITQLGNKFQLRSSLTTKDGNKNSIEASLLQNLNNAVKTILPTYTRLLAIKDFESRKFRLIKESHTSEGNVLLFEKAATLKEGGEFQRLIVTIRNDNTLTIDAVNFTGRSCIEATKPFETKVGKVIKRDMKPEAKVGIQQKASKQERERLRL